ncbi:MAG: hypothetical protein K6B69_05370 [Lachnospiraceae bacterium]|nr:hypothetical protein [Lachnospiraceae bacterium]
MKLLLIRENETQEDYDEIVVKLKRSLVDSGLSNRISKLDYLRPDGKYSDDYIEEMVDEMMARISPEYLMKRPLFDAVTLLRRLESSPEN